MTFCIVVRFYKIYLTGDFVLWRSLHVYETAEVYILCFLVLGYYYYL